MKIKITENANVKEVEISLGLSEKSKSALKAFAEKTINTVVNTGAQVIKKVNDFADKIIEEETSEAREHVAEIVKEAKEDAQRIVYEAMESYFTSEQEHSIQNDEDVNANISKIESDDAINTQDANEDVESKLEEKISKIPEGKKFTLAEYLDYLEAYKCEDKVNIEKEVCSFFAAIGYPASYVSRLAFETSATLEHINYNSVCNKIIEYIPNMSKDQIVAALKFDFDKWLETHEDVKMYCPKPTFRFLLKYFVKKIQIS